MNLKKEAWFFFAEDFDDKISISGFLKIAILLNSNFELSLSFEMSLSGLLRTCRIIKFICVEGPSGREAKHLENTNACDKLTRQDPQAGRPKIFRKSHRVNSYSLRFAQMIVMRKENKKGFFLKNYYLETLLVIPYNISFLVNAIYMEHVCQNRFCSSWICAGVWEWECHIKAPSSRNPEAEGFKVYVMSMIWGRDLGKWTGCDRVAAKRRRFFIQ